MSIPTDSYPGAIEWSRLREDVAIVSWPSFLVAAVATTVCFAFLDPLLIGHDEYPPPAFATRMSGYAVGFFFFWLIAALSSLLTLYLVRTSKRRAPDDTQGSDSNGAGT